MAIRRHLALPKIALAAALGATALATTAAASEHQTPAHSDGTHSANAFPSGYGDQQDWNTMVPDSGPVLS